MHEVPLASWLSILISPPNFLMMRRATVRPSPDPSVAELASLVPVAEALAVLQRAGL